MDCCKFENQMTRIIPSFAGFTEFTSSIPKLYWNVRSQEQRIFAICESLGKVICYADMLGENVDEIAKTLQDIEDGKLDPMIEAAIAQWFEDNQPEIMQDIEALQTQVGNIDDTLVDFSPNNTVKDAFDSMETYIDNQVDSVQEQIGSGFDAEHTVADALSNVASEIDSVTEQLDVLEPNNYYHPEHIGILRVATNKYNASLPDNDVRWGQGLCVANGVIVQGVTSPTAMVPQSRIYTRALNGSAWDASYIEDDFYHVSSIVYVPEIDRYLVSTGYSGLVYVCTRENFTIEQSITLGASAIVFGYDRVNNVLYGSDYGANLFTIDPSDFSTTNIPIWNSGFPSGFRGTLQDIDCYNGIIYILYSECGRIDRYRISDKKFIGSINFPNKITSTLIGETEGMSIVDDGKIYFSSVNYNNDMLAYCYTQIWCIDLNSPQTNQENWLRNTGRRSIVVGEPTEANILGSQNPTGTSASPFPTIAEAIDFIILNPYVNTIALYGDHSDEVIFIDIPQITIEGQGATTKTGRIQATNAKTALRNFEVAPQVSSVTNFVQGFRCGMMMVDPSLTFANSPVPTSGHYLQTQGTLVTAFNNTNWPS